MSLSACLLSALPVGRVPSLSVDPNDPAVNRHGKNAVQPQNMAVRTAFPAAFRGFGKILRITSCP
jgi:hypothetical protein